MTTHRYPPADESTMPCCSRTMFDLASNDRVTEDPASVTCSTTERATGGTPISIDLTGLIIRPGDTLVLASKTPFTDQHWHMLAGRIKEHLPNVAVVLVDGIDGLAAYRPEG